MGTVCRMVCTSCAGCASSVAAPLLLPAPTPCAARLSRCPLPVHCHIVLQAKEMLEDMGFAKGGTAVVVGGATIAGFFAAACSLPFDYVKTQMQKMKPDPITGELPFSVSGGAG